MRFFKFLAILPVFLASISFADLVDDVVLKLRVQYNFADTKQKGLPAPTNPNPAKMEEIFKNGIGVEGSASVFLNENIAAEFGAALTMYKMKATALNAISANYSDNYTPRKKKDMFAVPLYVTAQYHIAPYGAIRPYFGAGFHYTYIQPRSNLYKVDNGMGAVLQAGVDFVFTNDSYINIDVKQFMFDSKVKYSTNFANNNGAPITSKVKLNPFVIGVGVGFKM